MQFGLIGERLSHSFSKQIHSMLGEYAYDLFSVPPDGLDTFLKQNSWQGLNVTIPYKKAVIPYCDELSEEAKQIGSVNTLVKSRNGRIKGFNTDLYGLTCMAKKAGIIFLNQKVLILGSGGTSLTAQTAAKRGGAKEIVVVSRKGPVTYETLPRHRDADIIINTTPVGMYPNTGEAAVDLSEFPACHGVLDVIYNPLRTALMLNASERGIPCQGGLYMLVAQAKQAAELFLGKSIAQENIDDIHAGLCRDRMNIVLIGMPGCGKSTLGKILSAWFARPLVDLDEVIEEKAGISAGGFIEQRGEDAFRKLESEAISEIGKRTGLVISTGGGAVVKKENYAPLKQNGMLFFLDRTLELLPTDGRPLSCGFDALQMLYRNRLPLYLDYADHRIDNNGTLEQTANKVREAFYETACD